MSNVYFKLSIASFPAKISEFINPVRGGSSCLNFGANFCSIFFLVEVFEKGLVAGLKSEEDIALVFQAYVDYQRRQLNFNGKAIISFCVR